MGVAQGRGVDVLTKQLDLLVANPIGPAGVAELRRQVGRQSQAMIDLAQQ